ncbi:MAG: maltose/maltodextrin ABC transporter substrate-binding protein MalE, partial [Verrucomicrobia bacterium]|nr:maltose/maltodextrin ABC transporter substrate-binding protein MalE [Verrucomicrobiota bacterium]
KNGIDFGVSPIPGIDGKPGRPFIGVSAAYLNRSSPNLDIAREFIEQYLVSDEGLAALNDGKSIGIPASTKLYEQVAKENTLLEGLRTCAEHGQVMPNVPEMGRFWTAVGGALQLATNGQETAQKALDDAASTMRKH